MRNGNIGTCTFPFVEKDLVPARKKRVLNQGTLVEVPALLSTELL
jgi:hypothetical protein